MFKGKIEIKFCKFMFYDFTQFSENLFFLDNFPSCNSSNQLD